MNHRRIRVAIAMNHPAQHFTRALQFLSEETDLQVQIYYWSVPKSFHDPGFGRPITWDVDLLTGYSWAAPAPAQSTVGKIRWMAGQMRATRPDVVIAYGWASPIARMSIIYCVLTRVRVLLYGDSTWQHSIGGRHRILRWTMLRILMHLCNGAVSTGAFNREFYIRYGMNPRLISPGVCPADTETFGHAYNGSHSSAQEVDQQLRIGFAGKLIAQKGVDELLMASALLTRKHDWSVTVVGDGSLMADLQALAAQLNIDDRVIFHGFANATEMPKLLASFDVVVVPSRLDMRVLVTIEAMAAGAAIVVSDATAVWGPGDLVEDGVTGLVYHSGDPATLAHQLSRLLSDPDLLATLRQNGRERSENFGPRAYARTIGSAARTSLRKV